MSPLDLNIIKRFLLEVRQRTERLGYESVIKEQSVTQLGSSLTEIYEF